MITYSNIRNKNNQIISYKSDYPQVDNASYYTNFETEFFDAIYINDSNTFSKERAQEINIARKNYAEKLFKKNAKNPKLDESIHSTLAELATLRHKIHSSGEYVFWRTKKGVDMEKSLFATLILLENNKDKYPELFPNDKIRATFLKMSSISKEARDNARVRNDDEKMEELITRFVDAKEELDVAIKDVLASVDKTYDTRYCPTGHARKGIDTYQLTGERIQSINSVKKEKDKERERSSSSSDGGSLTTRSSGGSAYSHSSSFHSSKKEKRKEKREKMEKDKKSSYGKEKEKKEKYNRAKSKAMAMDYDCR